MAPITVVCQSCPVETVTVYQDRAEVQRLVKLDLKAGLNEVVISKIVEATIKDSVRVEGKGEAVITDVTFVEKFVTQEEKDSPKVKELRSKLESLKQLKVKEENERNRVEMRKETLKGIAGSLAKPADKESKSVDLLTDSGLEGLGKFLDFYGSKTATFDDQLITLNERLKKLDEEIEVAERNLNCVSSASTMTRDVSIFLDAKKDGPMELKFFYMVGCASWKPTYDIRVFTDENIMKIHYFGLICQSTGEDWNDVKLSLSTATPSVGGQIPELGTKKVSVYKATPTVVHNFRPQAQERFMTRNMKMTEQCEYMPTCFDYDRNRNEPEIAFSEAMVHESTLSTMFEVARTSTIPSDQTEHKVSIALIDLKPEMNYQSVPAKATNAFLTAKVKNSSTYALLAGPTSIFLDNNFIAQGQLKSVSPAEEFSCSLGVDPAIRVSYKPAKNYTEESGLLTKSTRFSTEQTIEVKNTRANPIQIKLADQLPLSTDEKIKVHLVEPNLKQNDKEKSGVNLTKWNILEWDLKIGAGETREIKFKYEVEYPRAVRLTYTEESHA